jgi:replicative DNA helicase
VTNLSTVEIADPSAEISADPGHNEPVTSFSESKPRRKPDPRPSVDASALFDRTPPHHTDAERSLIGSILLDPKTLNEVIPIVPSPNQFYHEAHGLIYACLIEIDRQHQSGDLVQLTELLRAKDALEQIGGTGFLMELAQAVPSAANAPYYAKLIADSARLRRLIDASGEIMYDAYTQGGGSPGAAKNVIDLAEKRIFDIASEDVVAEPEQLDKLLEHEIIMLEDRMDGNVHAGLPTGFRDLDERLSGGLQDEEMVILAARPSMGKTAIALNIAEQVAFGGATPWTPRHNADPVPVGVFSLEMARGALTQRLLSARSGVDAAKIRSGKVSDHEWELLQRASAELARAPIYIDDTPGMTVLELRAKARRMKLRYDIRCIVIDYLQLLTSPTQARESRQVEVSEISRSIKSIARELKVPVLCLAQLNRGAEQREGNRPKMSDLRESGSIEQDADVVMLLHREAYYHRGDPAWDPHSPEFDEDNRDKLNMTELIVAKQRNGPTGTVKLVWDSASVRFKNHDGIHAGGSYGFSREISGANEPNFNQPQQQYTQPNAGYDGPSDFADQGGFGADFAPKSEPAPTQHPPRQSFAPGSKSGPESDFRDGSGNDVDFDDDNDVDGVPF